MKKQKIIETQLGVFEIRDELLKMGCKKFLLVYPKSLEHLRVIDSIEAFDIPFARFSDFSPNPEYSAVCAATAMFRAEGCDSLVAIGGGSTIDVAKGVKLCAKLDPDSGVAYFNQPLVDSGIPLIAMPTTSGSGSESTPFAVISNQGEKHYIEHESLLPDVAVLDASHLSSLPEYQRKCVSLDAFAHCCESMLSTRSTPESMELAREGMRLILSCYRDFDFNYTLEAGRTMMRAANLGGQAIAKTHTVAAHAMSYRMTKMFGLPHGHAVSLCLPIVLEHIMRHSTTNCTDPRGVGHLTLVLKEIATILHGVSITDAIVRLRIVLAELQMQVPKSVTEEQVEELVAAVEPDRLVHTPVAFTRDALRDLYMKVLRIRK